MSDSASTVVPLKKFSVCKDCGKGFSTSSHLARHSRVHSGEKNHKCPYPGCEHACSRADNLQSHYVQVHQKSKGSRSGTDSSLSPPSSASSSPAPRFSSVSTVNSPRALMSSPLHPGVGGPHSNPHPHGYPAPGPYNFASPPGSQGRPRFSAELSGQYSPYPSPSTMPHSNMPGHQNPSFNYNLAPLQRHGNVHQPYASSSRTPAPPHYPWATYPAQPSTPGNPTDAPVQWNPSQPPSSEFSELFQPPGY